VNRKLAFLSLLAVSLTITVEMRGGAVISADPSNYRALLRNLKPGDTLSLAAGLYTRLKISNLNGTPAAWITITGPDSGPPAVIAGEAEYDTVDIVNSSYVAIENLRIDSRGIPGAFGISTKGHEENITHDIRIEGNTLVGQNGGQQTDAISTKSPTWGWIIRYNQILGAGTGMYLGDPNGTQPFVNGLIEHNLIKDTIGYNLEIKDQNSLPDIPGMPGGPTSTIIRNNVFIKNDQRSPDGDRPNVLVSGFPATGKGSLNMYEIYGNYFLHNHREALFQGSGRVSLHDNVFVDGPETYSAVVLRTQNNPLKLALVYNNTIYTSGKGIYFGTRAEIYDAVVGNLVFGSVPISGRIIQQSDNVVAPVARAPEYVRSPAFSGAMDFYPLAGQCQGAPLDLSSFDTDTDFTVDFNGISKVASKGAAVYRGAYAGEGSNPGWSLSAGMKAPAPPAPKRGATVVWLTPSAGQAGSTVQIAVTGADFAPESTLAVSGPGVEISEVKVESASRITATLKIAAGAAPGVRGITVRAPTGTSNPANFRINARKPTG
jgi:hypothetical protein